MNQTTLIIILMSSNSSHNIEKTIQNDRLIFNRFDCRVPKKLVSFLTKDQCQPAKLVAKMPCGRKVLIFK